MEVVSSAWLCDYEVYQHLKENREQRDKIAANIGRPVHSAENLLTIEFETLDYFQKHATVTCLTPEKISSLMEYLKTWKLTKAEKLQIVNLLPRSEVDFYLVKMACDSPSFTLFDRLWKNAKRGSLKSKLATF